RGFVESNVTASDLEGAVIAPERRPAIEALLADLVRGHGYRDVTVTSSQGEVLATTAVGGAAPVGDATTSAISKGRAIGLIAADGAVPSSSILLEAIPVVQGTDVRLVFQIRRDATPILELAGETLRDLVMVTVSAGVVLALLLYVIFRAASIRLQQQDAQLLESRRRDPLTGLLNHGAAVAALTDFVEQARADATSI